MPDQLDMGYAFRLPPRRAIQYFKDKGYAISFNWWETYQTANARAFTVAKAMRFDVLADIRAEMDNALVNGITPREFVSNLAPRLKAKGWWGKSVVQHPDGTAELVQLGSPHRLKTIYKVNMDTARAVSRHQVQQATVSQRPYWMYDALEDGRTRPHHAAMDGQVFHHDDPFWDTHYPPNGFNCRCRVQALTGDEVEQRKLKINTSEDKLHPIQQRVGVDKQTGEVIYRPATEYRADHVHFAPDPGWNYNPGAAGGPFDPGRAPSINEMLSPVGRQQTWRDLGLVSLPATLAPGATRLPRAATPEEQYDAFYAATSSDRFTPIAVTRSDGKKDTLYNLITTPDKLDDVYLTNRFVRHLVDRDDHREEFANYIIPALQQPAEVWRQWGQAKDGRVLLSDVFVTAFPDRNAVLVVREDVKIGALAWTFFPLDKRPANADKFRTGHLVYRAGKEQENER